MFTISGRSISSSDDSGDSCDDEEAIVRSKPTFNMSLLKSNTVLQQHPVKKPDKSLQNSLFMIDSSATTEDMVPTVPDTPIVRSSENDKVVLDKAAAETSSHFDTLNRLLNKVVQDSRVDLVLAKIDALPPIDCQNDRLKAIGRRQLKRERKLKREQTKGDGWFDFKAQELTEERKRDLEILQMRDVLDQSYTAKRGSKKDAAPKFFQVGTIMDHAADFYSSRIPKKQRKQTLADELMADVKLKRAHKRKYAEILEERNRKHKFKKLKKRKKK